MYDQEFDDASSDSETSVDDYSTDGATSSSRHDDNMSDFPQFGEFNNHEAFVVEIIREHEMQAANRDATRELVLLINQLLDCQMSMSGNAEERAVVLSPGSTSGPSSSSTSGPSSSSTSGPSSRFTFDVSANGPLPTHQANPSADRDTEDGPNSPDIEFVATLIDYLERHGYESTDDLQELRKLLDSFLTADDIGAVAAVARATLRTCEICEGEVVFIRRRCCDLSICDDCLKQYLQAQVLQSIVRIQCPGSRCQELITSQEIRHSIDPEVKVKYEQFLVDANREPHRKTCPRCSEITTVDLERLKGKKVKKFGFQVECSSCHLVWCFTCQAPRHEGFNCKQYRAGDKPLLNWAKEWQDDEDQVNARKCPRCKVLIQRNLGCSHMTCTRCSAEFCYDCGKRMYNSSVLDWMLESHGSKLSIFGCKKNYLPHNPVGRKLTRGAVFTAKVVAVPVVGSIAVGLAVGLIPIALLVGGSVYGGLKIRNAIRNRSQS